MATELAKRTAELAVNRFGLDAAQVQRTWEESGHARSGPDLVDSLVRARLLTPDQAAQLLEALDKTQLDARSSERRKDTSEPPAGTEPAAARPDRIGGYRLLGKLGAGGMGTVYLAYQESAYRQVAVKVLSATLASKPAILERFAREARHSLQLNHSHIVRGLDVGIDEATGQHFLVMEYVDGPNAQVLMDRGGPLSVGDAVRLALDIAYALEYAHSHSIIHRDIKPENILITRSGVAKLSDLGLSKQTDLASNLTATRQGFGTPYYMPYEQAINAKYADGRSDIYSLGATLYHLVTGRVPFEGKTQIEILEKKDIGDYPAASLINPNVPDELNLILDKMLARNPDARYQTASEFIIALERSRLASTLLSFVDPSVAERDPVVRSQAALSTLATQPDLQAVPRARQKPDPDHWYVRYHTRSRQERKLRLSTHEVLERVRDGRLPGNVLASPTADGKFRPLNSYAVFHKARTEQPALGETADELSEPGTLFWYLLGGLALFIALVILIVFLLLIMS